MGKRQGATRPTFDGDLAWLGLMIAVFGSIILWAIIIVVIVLVCS